MEIRRATPEMFDGIHAVLSEFGSTMSREDWRRIIDYRFSDQEYRGWVSMLKGEIVGFLGAIFSQRGTARFCSLTSWITKREHRSKANLHILAPMLELGDHTLLNFSASAFTAKLFQERLGFDRLDDELVVIPAVTPRLTPRGWERHLRPDLVLPVLDEEQRLIWRDHLGYGAQHLVFTSPKGHLYVVASKTKLRRLPVSHVHHVSNPDLFAEAVNLVQRELWRRNRTLATTVDSRLLEGHPIRGTLRWRLQQPRLFRPGAPAPARTIDSLYTELVMLNPAKWTFNH